MDNAIILKNNETTVYILRDRTEIEAKQILMLKDELYQILANHSSKSLSQIEKDADRDHWMTANDAAEYGIIDSILN